jgi:hypothetical protein
MAGDVFDEIGLEDPDRVLPRPVPAPTYYSEWKDGREARRATAAAIPSAPPRAFTLLTPAAVLTRPRMAWGIKGVVPERGLLTIYGAWGSGKGFLKVSMAAALAEGVDWFGYRTKKPWRVVCIELEGAEGVRQRIEAWEEYHGRIFPEGVKFIFDNFRLCDPLDVVALGDAVEAAGGADLVLIDTLNRAAPELDENSSRDMGLVIDGCRQLEELLHCVVGLVTHTGKDASRGMRGHSSLPAAADAAIEVRNGPGGREWAIGKMKDGADGASHRFRLEVVDLGVDEDGDAITSCVAVPDLADDAPVRPALPGGGNQRIVYDALGPVLREFGQYGKAGAPATRPCIEIETAVSKVRDRLPVESARRNERAREAIKGLVARRVLGFNEGWLWLA